MKSRNILLRDTRGTFYLGIRLPTSKYTPEPYNHSEYIKKWRRRNKQKLLAYGRNYYKQHLQEFKQYYIKNRQHILRHQKEYRNQKKRGSKTS